MKIAVVLTGHCRDFDKTFENFKINVFEKYKTDVYFNTWNVNQKSVNSVGKDNLDYEYVDTDNLLEKLKPYLKNYNFEDWEYYSNNRFPNINFVNRQNDVFETNERAKYHGSFYVERIRDQWWMVKKAWELIKNPYEYDLIMRVRFDMLIEHIEFKRAKFVVPKSIIEYYKIDTHWSDYFAYGEPDAMYKYFHQFNAIENIYVDYNFDISHAEQLNEFYMKDYGNHIESFIDWDIKYNKIN